MKTLTPGHEYLLENMDGGTQLIQFIRKEEQNGEFVTIVNGTTNEEVLAVLIDRLRFLDKKMPSTFNVKAFVHLELALSELNNRTAERKERGVEGTNKP